jgi:tellurite resistance protein TerC
VPVDVPPVLWLATIGALVGVIALDLVVVSRQSQPFGVKAATRWVIFYVSLAALFAVGVGLYFGCAIRGNS